MNEFTFDPQPLDYAKLTADGIPEIRFTRRPYLPAEASVWAVGATGSAKSMWALAMGCELSREGHRVVYLSQENPQAVEVSRLARLGADPAYLAVYHYQGFDLTLTEHVGVLSALASGAELVVVDTFTACWSGDENDNAAVVAYDRDVVRPILGETGTTFLTLDHTGHPQAFVSRRGVSAPRGASAKGQKADVILEFRTEDIREFSIHHAKNRLTGRMEPVRQFRVEGEEDEQEDLSLVEIETSEGHRAAELAEQMVEFIRSKPEGVRVRELRAAVRGGHDLQAQAMRLLEQEDPARVKAEYRMVATDDGPRRGKVWVAMQGGLL